MHIQPCLLALYNAGVRVYSPSGHEGEFGGRSIRTNEVGFQRWIVFCFSMVKGAWDMYEHRRDGTRE